MFTITVMLTMWRQVKYLLCITETSYKYSLFVIDKDCSSIKQREGWIKTRVRLKDPIAKGYFLYLGEGLPIKTLAQRVPPPPPQWALV